jgi:predicted dehydrogenase
MEDMLARTKPDLVDIVTPPETHLELVRLAAARGLPVVCQKPLAPTYAEAVEVVETAERAGVPLVVHENFRWQPWYREARRLIDANHFGKLHSVAFRLRPGDGQGPRAYLDRQPYFQTMPQLLVHETAIHWIDTFRCLMGDVAAVYASLRKVNPVLAGEDAGYLLFDFKSGATGLFDGNRLNDHAASNPRRTMGEMWLEGERGVLRLDGDAPVVEAAPETGSRAPLRPRAGRCLRRRLLCGPAVSRGESFFDEIATGEHGESLSG